MITRPASPLGSHRAPRLEHARVADAMRPGVISCAPETPLRDVARTMATHHVHCVVVPQPARLGESLRWSVLSDLDLAAAAAAGGVDGHTAAEIAATEALTVADQEPLAHAVQLMVDHQASHVVVAAAASGHPVGIVSTLDVAGLLAWGEA